ncbi:unnamed protein product [Polarella glacialis]|uniref:Uncharacterized protein n=1 Tax=Polarella glacialis TaxID=89957 RepID=A0A813GEJ0_POLGL|nr:unnamed protein product [Polarella glacialis]
MKRTSIGHRTILELDLVPEALVRIPLKPVSQQLPAVDPTSGEDVMILISRFQASAEQANRLLGCTLAGLFVLVSSVVFALQPLSPT